jgi:hypothetical protein
MAQRLGWPPTTVQKPWLASAIPLPDVGVFRARITAYGRDRELRVAALLNGIHYDKTTTTMITST